jgi:AraC-type DNA-binding domain-containing proteins
MTGMISADYPGNAQPVLERFIRAVERITGLKICVYDLIYFTSNNDRLSLPTHRREHCSAYCLKIKSNPEAWKRCRHDEYYRASEAHRRNAPFVHTCHAGLTDLVVPIREGTRQIGAIYLGQCQTIGQRRTKGILKRLHRDFGFDEAELSSILAERPCLNRQALCSHGDLLTGICDYIELAESLQEYRRYQSEKLSNRSGSIPMEQIPTFFLDQLKPHTAPIRKAVELLRTSYWKKISHSTIAREIGLSASHFTREFQKQTGLSFRRCVVMARVSAAYFLLKQTSLNLGEIADRLGYENISSLGRAFRSQVGASPRELLRIQPPPWLRGEIGAARLADKSRK